MAAYDKIRRFAGMAPAIREQDDNLALARKYINQIIGAQTNAAGQIMDQGNLAAANTQEAYKALANMRQQDQGGVQQAYQTAAGTTAVFSKGYSDAMQAKLDGSATDINSFLQKIGAPQGQMQNTQGGAGDVTYGMTGVIPATSLASQGAAAGAYAAMQPGNALAAGVASGKAVLGAAQSDYAKAIQQINAGAPNLIDSALARIQNSRSDALDRELRAKESAADRASREGIASKDRVLSERKFLAEFKQKEMDFERDRQKPNVSLSKELGYLVNDYGEAVMGKGGKPVAVRVTGSGGSGAASTSSSYKMAKDRATALSKSGRIFIVEPTPDGGFAVVDSGLASSSGKKSSIPPAAARKLNGTAAKIAAGASQGFTETRGGSDYPGPGWQPVYQVGADGTPVEDSNGKQTILGWQKENPKLDYQDALRQMAIGDPDLGPIPLDVAQKALNQYYKPGQAGRPFASFQERQRMQNGDKATADAVARRMGYRNFSNLREALGDDKATRLIETGFPQ